MKTDFVSMPVIVEALGRDPESFDNEMPGAGSNFDHSDRSAGERLAAQIRKAQKQQIAELERNEQQAHAEQQRHREKVAEQEARQAAERAREDSALTNLANTLGMSPAELSQAQLRIEHLHREETESFAAEIEAISEARLRAERAAELAYDRGRDRVAARHEKTISELNDRETQVQAAHDQTIAELNIEKAKLTGAVVEDRNNTQQTISTISTTASQENSAIQEALNQVEDLRYPTPEDMQRLEELSEKAKATADRLSDHAAESEKAGRLDEAEAYQSAATAAFRSSARATDSLSPRLSAALETLGGFKTQLGIRPEETVTSYDIRTNLDALHGGAVSSVASSGQATLSVRHSCMADYAAAARTAAGQFDQQEALTSALVDVVEEGEMLEHRHAPRSYKTDQLHDAVQVLRTDSQALVKAAEAAEKLAAGEHLPPGHLPPAAIPHAYLDAQESSIGVYRYSFDDSETQVLADPDYTDSAVGRGEVIASAFDQLDDVLDERDDSSWEASVFAAGARAKLVEISRECADTPHANTDVLYDFISYVSNHGAPDPEKFVSSPSPDQEPLF